MEQPATQACYTSSTPFRAAVLTIYQKDLYTELPEKLTYFAYAVETCPTTGRKHLQGFAYATTALRLTGWKKIFPTAHIEKMRGTFAQNEKYCSKQSTLVEFGVRPMENGRRRDLEDFCRRSVQGESLVDVSRDLPVVFVQYHHGLRALSALHSKPYEHDTVRGYWLWGVPGAGKTHYVKSRFDERFIKAQNKWFDNYNGEKTIVLEDYDCGKVLGHYLKIWMDKWACTGEVKGGTVHLRHHHFVVTSNYSIEQMFSEDVILQQAIRRRCEVIYFGTVFKPPSSDPEPSPDGI